MVLYRKHPELQLLMSFSKKQVDPIQHLYLQRAHCLKQHELQSCFRLRSISRWFHTKSCRFEIKTGCKYDLFRISSVKYHKTVVLQSGRGHVRVLRSCSAISSDYDSLTIYFHLLASFLLANKRLLDLFNCKLTCGVDVDRWSQ